MTKRQPSLAVKSKNGPAPAEGDDLERLRDILVGSHVRDSEQRIDEMNSRLDALAQELNAHLTDLKADMAGRFSDMQEQSRKRDESFNQRLSELVTALNSEVAFRHNLGQMLAQLSRSLLADENTRPDIE